MENTDNRKFQPQTPQQDSKLNKEELRAILTFLERTDIKGQESFMLVRLFNKLQLQYQEL